jgi:hypothetical protein
MPFPDETTDLLVTLPEHAFARHGTLGGLLLTIRIAKPRDVAAAACQHRRVVPTCLLTSQAHVTAKIDAPRQVLSEKRARLVLLSHIKS